MGLSGGGRRRSQPLAGKRGTGDTARVAADPSPGAEQKGSRSPAPANKAPVVSPPLAQGLHPPLQAKNFSSLSSHRSPGDWSGREISRLKFGFGWLCLPSLAAGLPVRSG